MRSGSGQVGAGLFHGRREYTHKRIYNGQKAVRAPSNCFRQRQNRARAHPGLHEGTHAYSPRMFGWINPGIVAYGGQEIDAGYEMFVIKRAFGDVQVVSE